VNEHRRFVQERFPSVRAETLEPVGDGWDSYTYEVDGEWIFQFPRLPGAEVSLRKQLAMLPELAQELPALVPNPEHVSMDPPCMGYRKIEGVPVSSMDAIGDGFWPERLGRFLFDLHLIPPEFVGMRMIEPAAWRDRYRLLLDVFRERVCPLLTAPERAASEAEFAAFLDDDRTARFAPGLIHHDLGPSHVLVSGSGDLAGVIDWGDAEVGDPAADLAWLLFGTPVAGERALAAYGGEADAGFRDRARFYHRVGPWHEVLYGLDTGQPRFVERGLAGLRERLVD
jgi:aminoglycoside phosphotransferase (APT) family kinase protein